MKAKSSFRLVFFGTPEYVLPIFKALHKEYGWRGKRAIAVVTRPPKKADKTGFITHSPVDNWAYKRDLPVIYRPGDAPEADLGILAAYGKIIPKETIEKFKYGILNIHPSLLPKYRGASPVQGAIANGDKFTGVTVIKIDEELDHGPIVSSFKEKILPDETAEELKARLFERSTEFVTALIPNYLAGKVNIKPQDHKFATFTKILKREDGFIEAATLSHAMKGVGSEKIYNLYRAMHPWPGIWTKVQTQIPNNKRQIPKRLKILKAHLSPDTDHRTLVTDCVQLEGKSPVSWEEFKKGYPGATLD